MDDERLKKYFSLFSDFWKLFKAHSDVEDTEEYWEEVQKECYAIINKYGESAFVSRVLAEIQLELERCGKEGHGHKDRTQHV